MCYAMHCQIAREKLSSATSRVPAPNMSMMNMSSNQLMRPASGSMQPVVQSSSALQVATAVRPYFGLHSAPCVAS